MALPSSYYTSQFDTTAATTTPNMHPDIIAKVAADGHAGSRAMHVEAAGLLRTFRSLRQAGGTSHAVGAGGSLNMNLELAKNFRFLLNTFYSDGGGRYIFGLGPDAIVRADGTVSPVHAASGIAGFEFQSDPKTAWYTYYGGAYFSRNSSLGAPGQYFGFGYPGSSNANREIQELTFGFNRTLLEEPQLRGAAMDDAVLLRDAVAVVGCGRLSQQRAHAPGLHSTCAMRCREHGSPTLYAPLIAL